MVTCRMPEDWWSDISACWYDWQTLIAALLALSGAYLTIRKIRDQISQNERHRSDQLERDRRAARVALPLTLSSVSELVLEMADEIAQRFERFRSDSASVDGPLLVMNSGVTTFEPVELRPEIIASFQSFVKMLEIDSDVRHVAALIAWLQILLARYRTFDPQHAAGEAALVSLLVDCGRVAYLNESMFSFARMSDKETFSVLNLNLEESWDQILGRTHSLLFFRDSPDQMMVAANDLVDRMKRAKIDPWIESTRDD